MNANQIDSNNVFGEDITRLFSQSKIGRLQKLGHDFLEEGCGSHTVIDHEGKCYIDCISGNGIYNLGRKNDKLRQALMDAVDITDQGNFPMISIEKARLAEKLADFIPGNLECTVFSVIRGESIDFACKLARGYTGRKKLVSVTGSWFGETGFAFSLSDRKDSTQYGPLVPDICSISFGDINAAKKEISSDTAAVFIEPVQGENGCTVAEPAYLKQIRDLCNKKGVLLVFDETQSGLGRCGSPFAFEPSGVLPDILVIGEALGGGIFPIAATVFTQKLNRFMNKHPMIHLSTFGGSDQGCRVAYAALEEYERLKPWENAHKQGEILKKEFHSIQQKYPRLIISVSGAGLLIALELQTDEEAVIFCRKLAHAGLLALPGEAAKSSIIFRPGLLIDDVIISEIVNTVDTVCNAMTEGN